jgi:hypothetical protein
LLNTKDAAGSCSRAIRVVFRGRTHRSLWRFNCFVYGLVSLEFGEVGRIEEAQNISNIVLASPYAFAYPEWRETGQDLALRGYKSRSLVPIIQSFPGNLLHMPEREPSDTPTPVQSKASRPASVRSLEKWKEQKMVKEPTNDDENIEEMDEKDLFLKLVQVSTQDNITRKQLYEIVKHAIKVTSKKERQCT